MFVCIHIGSCRSRVWSRALAVRVHEPYANEEETTDADDDVGASEAGESHESRLG